ncbi:MAG: carboxylesterase family protein [Proteobacteria bacterium]|nr:carboxylesterase family protein [Pseudomonadota bacterium]MDA1063108.1 carboxylesterase family protein [Pseudomonadota bacterium]
MYRFLLLAIVLGLAACERAPSVVIDEEKLIGKYVEDGKVAAFLGVPFAEPPVGELRWQGPQALATKVSRRDTTEFSAACMQDMRILDWYRDLAETFGGSADYYPDLDVSEDCLYLNVWTPTVDATAGLPVMVWVHGGSNRSGWSYEPNYRGHKLAQQDVVVVSVAYRQGVFGFLSHPELPADEPLANFAYWDLIASLQWVQDNIELFGGDPDRVTMFGESAGAQDILALMFAEPAKGLFHRAILESTAGFGIERMSSIDNEQARMQEFAKRVSPGNTSLAALRALPAQELLQRYEANFGDYYHSPSVDGQLFDKPLWESVRAAEFPNVAVVIGSNQDEWRESIPADISWDGVADLAASEWHDDAADALELVQDEQDPLRAADRLSTAKSMLCPSQAFARHMSAAGKDAWMYYFTRVREDQGGAKMRAFHGAEYAYPFDTHDAYMTTNATDRALTRAMQSYWVSFAATGNPNSEGTTDWPRYAAPDFLVQELGDEVFSAAAPEPELCALFEEGLAARTAN